MTKNKLAKLATRAEVNETHAMVQQEALPADFDPVAMLDESLGRALQPFDIETFGATWYEELPSLIGKFKTSSIGNLTES